MRNGVERDAIRVLDACLNQLEEANLRGVTVVSAQLAARVAPHLPGIRNGMSIGSAIQLAFDEQQRVLAGRPTAENASPNGRALAQPTLPCDHLDEATARSLTEQIRAATKHVCLLLLEAHQRGAPAALGYGSWEQYVRAEFGLSRSRSYELLDQARVILTLKDAAHMSGIPDISAYTAGKIKRRLQEVVGAITIRLQGRPTDAAGAIVHEAVAAAQAQPVLVRDRPPPRGLAALRQIDGRVDHALLLDIVNYLAGLPPPSRAVSGIDDSELINWTEVAEASGWLTAFTAHLSRRRLKRASTG